MRTGITVTQFPFVAQLTAGGRRELAALAAARVKAAQQLLQRGDAAGGVYLVTRGALRVFYITAEGREATLYRVEAGAACILSLTSTLNDEPYPAWVDSGPGGADFVRIPSEMVHRLIDADAAFRQFAFASLTRRVLDLMRRLEELGSERIEQRVARFLLRQEVVEGCVRITQSGIASDLGTAREVVFRALRSLGDRQLVRTSRMRVRIVDRRGLAAVATGGRPTSHQ
jgi:CRP/FNR family transcriptional regulator